MARIRSIKPKFFLNEELAALPFECRLLFIGLWTQADREGRLEDRPKRLKVELFPYDEVDVDKMLSRLASTNGHPLITRYEADGAKYIQINKFSEHQYPHIKEPVSTIPAPVKNQTKTRPA